MAAPAALLWKETCLRRAGTVCSAFPQSMSFFNGERTFRIPISKIVSAQVVNVGLEIVRDRASAQPEFFGLSEDGAEFVVDLIHALEDADFGRGEPEMQNVTNYVLMGDGGDDILLEE